MADNTISLYTVLFTAQKQKKFKTWQDGTMKYYSSNRKLILTDEKGYNIDRKFYKGGIPNVGDELEFDGHIVTVESFESSEAAVPTNQPLAQQLHQQAPRRQQFPPPARQQQPLPRQLVTPPTTPIIQHPSSSTVPQESSVPSSRSPIPSRSNKFKPPSMIPKKRMIKVDPEEEEAEKDDLEAMELCEVPDEPMQDIEPLPLPIPPAQVAVQPSLPIIPSSTIPIIAPQKRVRVGLSKRTMFTLHQSTLHSTISASSSRTMPALIPASSNHTVSSPVRTTFNHTMSSPAPAPSVNTNTVPLNNSFTKASVVARDTSIIDRPQPLASSATPTSKSSLSSNSSDQSNTSKPFKSPCADGNYTSSILQFPNSKKALTVLKSKKYPKRNKVVPTKFPSPNFYKETFRKIIHEHLEILLINCGVYFYSMYEKFGKNKQGADLERTIRSKGLPLYVQCHLKGDQRYQSDKRYRIVLKGNREHYSKYNKDDIWVISKVSSFESSQTFLARSTYFGPFSDGSLEIDCLSPRDVRIATKIWQEDKPIYALRTMSASTEFMMLDTLDDRLDQLPLLPYILTDNKSSSKKKKVMAPPLPMPKLEHIRLTREDGIDVEAKIVETITHYKLNQDQESVLRRVARSVIMCPGWNESTEHPLVLVHGVYGSGKSFLAAVIIIFIQDIIDTANDNREPEDAVDFKILISSMTNVAVDRILQTLLKLGFDHFIRIGSMKKIAKSLLPYTAKARLSSNEELKELEQMLEDCQNSEEDSENIATAIQRFRKSESTSQIHATNVVGTTFMSSTFEVFNGVKFPFVLVDESSQLMEPLTMVPLARFSCNRLVMIGDPLQLPPTIATHAEEGKVGKGLDKTMFDRMIEMGHESIMLRTQYRCHPRISGISNSLFYDRRLLNGVTNEDRKPLVKGLPTLVFVDVGGTEQKSMRSQSYSNDTEIALSAHIIQTMLSFDILPIDLGVISLYKEQADKLSEYLSNNATTNSINSNKGVQISTVDAFQGGEKEVIVLSTVRTTESPFMDNQPRINVALTRAKRHLIILGNKSLFSMNELWSKVLWDCQEHCLNGKSFAALLSELKTTN